MNKIFRIVWSQATQSWVVVSELTKAHKKQSSSNSQGSAVKFSGNLIKSSAIALALLSGHSAYAALNQPGTGSDNAVALGEAANANQARAVAIGKGATISSGQDTIAIGTDTKAKGHTSIVIGRNAKTTNDAEGTVVIGRDAFSEGSGNGGRPNTVVGRGAYTAFGENGTYRLNAATALGFQAGAGLRTDPSNGNKLVSNETNADNNAEVLVKAGYGLDENAPADTKTALQGGNVNNNLTFYRRKHINEATAVGAEARAIGDQSIAIGGQVVAGDGVVALGGNDTDQLRNNKYQVVTDDAVNRTKVETIDDYNLAYTESTRTVADQYNKLVGRAMPTGYRSTYGQSGSVVIGMEAHSTTALGTAIGTNSVVRMGAFGATAIGAGSTVQPNADAAVAIGMGSVANGAYALAGGTASWADYGDIALGYQAKATGKDGAIAMGRATNAQGDSSIMIGGANIASAAAQNTNFQKNNGQIVKKTVTEKIDGKDVNREYTFAGTTPTAGTVAEAYKELTGITMDTAALDFAKNKNGHASTSLGVHALSKGDLGTAIGAGARSDAIGSVALGTGAHATRQNAVAIGTGSTTDLVGSRQLSISYDKDGNIVDDNSPNKAYTFNWAGGTNTAEGDVVSFGSSGAERQLKNVAAGRVADDSTDAINGSQLHSIAKKVALGWNIAGDPKTKVSGIGADDQVNFVNGNGTTVTVTKQEEVKNGDTVTTPKGANVKFDVKAADNTITVTNDGVKVNTGNISTAAVPTVTAGDENKIATVGNVVDAIKAAAWKATSDKTANGENTGKKDQEVKAGDTVTFEADKNIKIAQNGSKFTFSTKDNVTFTTVQVGGDQGPKLSKTDDGNIKVSDKDGTDPVKVTNVKDGDISADSKDAINGSQFHKLANNTITLQGQTGDAEKSSTKAQNLDTKDGIKFTVKSSNGDLLEVTAAEDTITLTPKTGTITTDTNGVPTANTTGGKLVTADQLVNALTEMGWKATSGNEGTGKVTGTATELIKAGNTVTFKAGDNLAIKQSGKEFIYSLNPVLSGLTSAEFKNQAGDKTVINSDGMTITPKDAPANPVSLTKDGLDNGGKTIKNVTSGLTNYPAGTPKEGLVDLSKPATGTPAVPDTTAATVGDLRNMGWVVSSDKTTGELTKAYTDQVKNADEVKFVGEGGVTVSGKTENGIRTITVKAEAQEMPEQPVSYTTADGTKVYPKTVTKPDGTKETKFYPNPDGTGTEIPKENVIASINGPEGTKAPTTLSNVAGNLDGAKKGTTAPTTGHAPVNTTDAAAPNYVNPNNAATVGDVLNAGWNLQNNGTAKDFVKPYDTVNFVNGANTTAVVTTAADGTTSNVTYNVTGLPVTFTDKDGKPVSKIGDKYYPVNEKGQPVTPDGKPAVKTNAEGKPVTEDGTVIEPIDTAANPLKSNLVNPNVTNSKAAPNNQTTSPTQLGNVANGAETFKPADNVKLANDGKWYPADKVEPNGQPKTGAAPVEVPANIGKAGLIDFSNSNPNNAATVGDLQNLGWIVSAEGNNYSDQVRNANEVKFVGEGTATVTGKTDDKGVRTITVKVDDQVSTNNAVTPVVYTDKDGNKVYPIKGDDGTVTYHTTPDGKGDNDQVVPNNNVVTSINGPEGTTSPTELKNVKNNIPAVNDADKKVTNPDGTEKGTAGDVNNINKAPLTATEAADLLNPTTKDGKPNPNFVGNNAATVSDVLNAGWNLQGNGSAVDFVKPFDTVNFVNGKGTKAVVETVDNLTSTVKFDVDAGEITADKSKPGAVKGPVTADEAKKLADDLANAQKAVNNLAPDADDVAKKKAQDALKAAQDAAAPLNKVATAQNVADMINNSGFTLKADKVDGGENTTVGDNANKEKLTEKGELIKPGSTVTMKAGKNMTVKHEANGNITYATKDDVEFNTVTVGKPAEVYTNKDGKPLTKTKDGKYTDSDGNEVPEKDVITSNVSPVKLATEKAIPADNNQDGKAPTTALNVTSTDGKPTQITGVGSVLSNESIPTNTNGTPTAQDKQPKLVNLEGKKDPKTGKVTEPLSDETLNSAATVRDLANMGWVVGAPENGYVDTVKNANKVDFKGENGISVTGKTNDKGVREITISVAEGKVTNDVKVTKADGTVVTGVKGPKGKLYEKGPDGKPDTSKPITLAEGDKVDNEGSKFVSGNAVATAIQESGWNIGKADAKDVTKAFEKEAKVHDKVNPNDDVKFVDGQNTVVKMVTVDAKNEDGSKKATTFVKVDVTGLPVQYTDKNGTPVTKVGDKYFTVDKDGNPTTTEVKPADLTTNMVNPAAKPNEIGAPTTLGNVKSNLPSVNDADKNAKDVDGNPIAGKDNKSAPIDAAKAADIAKNAGNNAATVSDVLNTGWNLQNNGEAKDFVKPYDTVNFVDGKGTKAVVKTEEDGTTSNVKFDIDTGSITNNADGSVQGPVTPEMTKALEDATNALNSLPPTAPAAVIDAAKKAVADAANNIANVANKVATAQDVANAINKSGFTLTTSANGGEKISGTPEMINPGKKVEMVAGKNMTVKQESNGKVTYATASNVTFDSVQFGDKGPKITNKAGNINVSGPDGKTPTKITGVAPGEISATSKDAINGSQLHAVASNLNNKINKVGKHADAGTASALAAANIPQAYTPGKSLVGIAAGNYQGQNGLAVGMSRISDNGKIIIRLSGTANSQGKTGVAAGVGYQW